MDRKDVLRKRSREYYQKNKPAILERHRRNTRKNLPKYLYLKAKHRARRLGIHFSLQETDIVIPEFCPVLGVKLDPEDVRNRPSVDRVNNALGYTPSNVRVISLRANKLKNNATVEEIAKILAYMLS